MCGKFYIYKVNYTCKYWVNGHEHSTSPTFFYFLWLSQSSAVRCISHIVTHGTHVTSSLYSSPKSPDRCRLSPFGRKKLCNPRAQHRVIPPDMLLMMTTYDESCNRFVNDCRAKQLLYGTRPALRTRKVMIRLPAAPVTSMTCPAVSWVAMKASVAAARWTRHKFHHVFVCACMCVCVRGRIYNTLIKYTLIICNEVCICNVFLSLLTQKCLKSSLFCRGRCPLTKCLSFLIPHTGSGIHSTARESKSRDLRVSTRLIRLSLGLWSVSVTNLLQYPLTRLWRRIISWLHVKRQPPLGPDSGAHRKIFAYSSERVDKTNRAEPRILSARIWRNSVHTTTTSKVTGIQVQCWKSWKEGVELQCYWPPSLKTIISICWVEFDFPKLSYQFVRASYLSVRK